MRFTVRSLGGKLIISAALTLMLCMLLFSAASWYVLKSLFEHEAKSDATSHLILVKQAYRTQVASLKRNLTAEAAKTKIIAALTSPRLSAPASSELASAVNQYGLSSAAIITMDRKVIVGIHYPKVLSGTIPLIKQALGGETVSALQMADVDIAVPIKIKNGSGKQIGVLLASQNINDGFASDLVEIASNQLHSDGLNVVLCESKHILGTTARNITNLDRHISHDVRCRTSSRSNRWLTSVGDCGHRTPL